MVKILSSLFSSSARMYTLKFFTAFFFPEQRGHMPPINFREQSEKLPDIHHIETVFLQLFKFMTFCILVFRTVATYTAVLSKYVLYARNMILQK